MKRVELQPAYVLHRRPYRETSCLLEIFTPEHGRLSVIAKGVRKERSVTQGLLQAFQPLLISWSGKNELMTLLQVETRGAALTLSGECLFAGFYLNELLMCLLQKWDAQPVMYALYEKALRDLQSDTLQQQTLRSFEKGLLEELGYGLLPKSAEALERAFSPEKYYRFTHDQGLVLCETTEISASAIFSGKTLHAIAKEEWHIEGALRDAKRLTRFVLAPLLGARQIHSRKLFL
jgi:DNA repair protein RecO (recombination protein O)